MDTNQFDRLTRAISITLSRRGLVGALATTTLGLPVMADARKKRGKKRKKKVKITLNEFGCVNVGDACKNSSQCCSGVCQGKKDKRTCAGHHSGGCTPARSICATDNTAISKCNLDPFSPCFATTGNGGFCADVTPLDPDVNCQRCAYDSDCVALGFPVGSACVIAQGPPGCDGEAGCFGFNGSAGTACFPPGV